VLQKERKGGRTLLILQAIHFRPVLATVVDWGFPDRMIHVAQKMLRVGISTCHEALLGSRTRNSGRFFYPSNPASLRFSWAMLVFRFRDALPNFQNIIKEINDFIGVVSQIRAFFVFPTFCTLFRLEKRLGRRDGETDA
jgi:hypothetical protein